MIRLIKKPWTIAITAVLLLAVSGAWIMARGTATPGGALSTRVKRGDFKVTVTTSGDLRALRDIKITGPMNMQQAQIYNGVKIQTLVPEGTVVKEGDVVAVLDRSPAATKMTEVSLALQKAQALHEQAQLDSALNLSKAREEIKTMELALEEKRIAKDQAKYEAPSEQRRLAIDLEKAERAFAQAKSDYKTKTEQAQAKMREVGADFQRQKNLLQMIQDVVNGFTITAPAPGMVIYVKEWNGKKRTAGAQIGAWDPTVATLPDLSGMESITYINEIDIRRVVVGQPAVVTLDADPSKRLTGKVTQVANVGEQRPNADAKVFEVKVTLDRPDTTLRPGMTTGNSIQTMEVRNVLYIPLEAVGNDSGLTLVYKRNGNRIVKQEIETGAMNDDEVVVVRGLSEGDEVMVVPPVDKDQLAIARLPGSKQAPKPVAGGDTATSKPVAPPAAEKAPAPKTPDSDKHPPAVTPPAPKKG